MSNKRVLRQVMGDYQKEGADFKSPAGNFENLFGICRKSIFGGYFPGSPPQTTPANCGKIPIKFFRQ